MFNDKLSSEENILDDVSKHVEINLVALHKELDNEGLKTIEQNASESVKRVFSQPSIDSKELQLQKLLDRL